LPPPRYRFSLIAIDAAACRQPIFARHAVIFAFVTPPPLRRRRHARHLRDARSTPPQDAQLPVSLFCHAACHAITTPPAHPCSASHHATLPDMPSRYMTLRCAMLMSLILR